jgi:ABC-type branched-subunit amino acid transport system ATPase component
MGEFGRKIPGSDHSSGITHFQNIRLFNDLTVIDNVRMATYHQMRYPVEAMFRVGRFNR